MVILSFLGYLGEIESDSPTVCGADKVPVYATIYSATVSAFNFEVLICGG